MVSTFISLLDIQSWWEIPCIAHFCSLFSSAFNLPDIDIEDLESALLTDGTEETAGLLPELIVFLLKGCDALKNREEITTTNYQMFLRRFLRHECRKHNTKNYFDTDIDFQALPLRNKLLILYSLCHFRLESSNVQIILANLEADSLRVEPLGFDSKNSGYWYFYGTRLYREDRKPGGKSTIWQVICFTEEDWSNLALKFQNSTSSKERALYKILSENFIPKLPQLFRERERLRRRKLLQVRSSARIYQEKQKKVNQKEETFEIAKQTVEGELISHAANKFRTRTRRRSQCSSTASGISTYASSLRASTPSSEFSQHEASYLSPKESDIGTNKSYSSSINSPSIVCNKDSVGIKTNDSLNIIEKETSPIRQAYLSSEAEEETEINCETESTLNQKLLESLATDKNFVEISTRRIAHRRDKVKKKHKSIRVREKVVRGKIETDFALGEKREIMAPTTNMKLPGRQTNNSLSSIPENVFLSSVFSSTKDSRNNKSSKSFTDTTKSKDKEAEKKEDKKMVNNSANDAISKKKKSKPSETYIEKEEILQIGMHKVLLCVKNHRDAWPFMDPVDEEIAPRYYSIIRRPMDLLKMEEKLDNEEYKKYSEFRNDFKLIVNNCRLYNGQNNEYTEMVNNLQEAFDKATKKYLEQHSSDEDESFEYPDSRSNVFRDKSVNTSIIAQKEISKDILCKENHKEKNQAKSLIVREEGEDDIDKPSENRSGKKKRKDKDKRRKKKSRGQLGHVASQEGKNITEISGKEIEVVSVTASATNKGRKRYGDMLKLNELMLPAKLAKTEPEIVEKEQYEIFMPLNTEKKVADKQYRKSRESKQLEMVRSIRTQNVNDKEISLEVKPENLDGEQKMRGKLRFNSKRKCSFFDNEFKGGLLVRNKLYIQKKRNQTVKSKASKLNPCTKEIHTSNEILTSKRRQNKDNKKTCITSVCEKRKSRRRKTEQTKIVVKKAEEENKIKHDENDEMEEDGSISRCSSPSLFKVDLHEKYAKSASMKDEEGSFYDELKNESKSSAAAPPANACQKDDLLLVTSQNVSRSASPFNTAESDVSEKSQTDQTNEFVENKSEEINGEHGEPVSSPSPFFYLDKYDLIKQRRSRNTEGKRNHIVKEVEKNKYNKKASVSDPVISLQSKEKNQKLKETIEKLKVKTAKSKERSVLIDEIFGVKPAQQPRDEKTIYEKLRDSCLDAKSPLSPKKNNLPVPVIQEAAKDSAQNSDHLVDELEQPKSISSETLVISRDKTFATLAKFPAKKVKLQKKSEKKTVASGSKTNLEALELETEQTLKDINRWLEHTPRFPEFSSASNSPSRYNLLDDFDAVASKIDPADFRRPVSMSTSKLEPEGIDEIAENNKQEIIEDLIPPVPTASPVVPTGAVSGSTNCPSTTALSSGFTKPRESSGTTQFLAHPPPPPHVKNQQQKDTKRKTLKEKLTGCTRRKDILRTIDRLQPGKTKGNLIGSIPSGTKIEDLFPSSATNKIKEIKNSLVVKTDESGPKLSMGSVLQTEEFGLGQLHNFSKTENETKLNDSKLLGEKSEINEKTVAVKKEEIVPAKDVDAEKSVIKPTEKFKATPNLSAWFKAFGTPKKTKKLEEEDKKATEVSLDEIQQIVIDRTNSEQAASNNSQNIMKSPLATVADTFSLPAPRQRKASTGSTVSERSSFSQDPDSPRVGIDDRFCSYTGPYPSPIGASPIMVSPKPDEIGKPSSPYPLNGAIKVGFYQDTTTKSSPEKSCSPRELPSPYPQYSQNLYSTSSSSLTVNPDGATNFAGFHTSSSDESKAQAYAATTTSTIFEQYKQPRSQESDYDSMSPNNNSDSPYQQPRNSPYQQIQTSSYQQQNSPYQQSQNSALQNQSGTTSMLTSPKLSSMTQIPQEAQGESPKSQANSAYHQQTSSTYQQLTNSPYHQSSTPPYQQSNSQQQSSVKQESNSQQQSPQENMRFLQQRQQAQPATVNPTNVSDVNQRQNSAETSFQPKQASFAIQDAVSTNPFQPSSPPKMSEYVSENTKENKNENNMINEIQPSSGWSSQIDVSISQTHHLDGSRISIPNISTSNKEPTQLNTPPLQADQINAIHSEKSSSMQCPNYSQFANNSQRTSSKPQCIFTEDISLDVNMGMHNHPDKPDLQGSLKAQDHQAVILNIGVYEGSTNQQRNNDQTQNLIAVQDQYNSSQKHQQMFDSFLGSMASSNKNNGVSKKLDIGPSKPFEIVNRVAAVGFTKDFSTPLVSGQQKPVNAILPNNQHQQQSQIAQTYHLSGNEAKSISTGSNISQNTSKNLNTYQHQMQQHFSDNVTNKMSTFPTPMLDPANDLNKMQQHHQPQQLTATNYSNSGKMSQDAVLTSNPRQEHMSSFTRNQQLNMDITSYKTYNNPASVLDPLRNLNHPLSIMDESLLGISSSSAPVVYYEKNIPPTAHMFSKNLSQQMFQNAAPYVPPGRDQQLALNSYSNPGSTNVNATQLIENFEGKQPKRKKKRSTPVEITPDLSNMLPAQQHPTISVQNSPSTQGFQLYSDLKTASSTNTITENSAISLKTTSSMVPGSAFNFGPSPAGLGLPSGMYSESTSYLDPYYLPTSHRTSETTSEKSNNATAATTPTTPYQFLTHSPVRPTYPFINSQLDTNSPIYQQYIQRQEQELRARMMINQGLLGSTAGAPGSYAQPGYRAPSLGIPKHYDMSRQTWF